MEDNQGKPLLAGIPEIPRLNEAGRERPETSDDGQLAAVCRYMRERLPAQEICVRFLATGGMRLVEMYGLKPDQIKNEKIALTGGQTKTDTARVVYVEPSLLDEMRALVSSGGCLMLHDCGGTTLSSRARPVGQDRGLTPS